MKQINILDARPHLSRLVADLEAHEESEIALAWNGRPVARIVPLDRDPVDTARAPPGPAKILLDTPIALWAVADSPELPAAAREYVLDPAVEVFVSSATLWEIAIKHARHPRIMPVNGSEAQHLFLVSGYRELTISWGHTAAVDGLPDIHGDPFYRILVAQDRNEPMRLLPQDTILAGYSELVTVM